MVHRLGLLEINQDVVAFHSELECVNLRSIRRLRYAALQIESPRVPGTHNRFALNPALTQRSATVRTPVIERVEISVEPRKAYSDAFNFYLDDTALRRRLSQAA